MEKKPPRPRRNKRDKPQKSSIHILDSLNPATTHVATAYNQINQSISLVRKKYPPFPTYTSIHPSTIRFTYLLTSGINSINLASERAGKAIEKNQNDRNKTRKKKCVVPILGIEPRIFS